jgi:hypothetical protein
MAIVEGLVVGSGLICKANSTDHLFPTRLDVGEVETVLVEDQSTGGPSGGKVMSELPT